MKAKVYIITEADLIDKRKQLISLTEKSLLLLPKLEKLWHSCECSILAILEEDISILSYLDNIDRALKTTSFHERFTTEYSKYKLLYMRTIVLVLLVFFIATYTFGTDTKIIVRVKAKDAKFIGSSLGGAYIIIRNSLNQQILAEGKTSGAAGNTNLIMITPIVRGNSIVDDQTAKFFATINIEEPIFVTIEELSPINNKQASTKITTQL